MKESSDTAYRTIHVGCGTRGAVHLRNLMAMPHFRPVALVDVVEQYFDDACSRHGLCRSACFKSLGDALRTVEAEAVIISSPAPLHASSIQESLESGRHVWVEKPFTCDLASAERCVALAHHKGLKIMVGNQARLAPPFRTFRRLLAEKALGEPGYGLLVFHKVRPKPYNPSVHEQLWQMDVHNFDTILSILQRPPLSIAARSFVPPWSQYRQSATVSALIEFEGGLHLNMLSSSDSKAMEYRMRIECAQGAVVQDGYWDGRIRLLQKDKVTDVPADPCPNGWSADVWQFHLFYDYLSRGIEPETSGRLNLPTIRLCDAAQRSSETGQTVQLVAMEYNRARS
ncbi:MAG: Gfo/Idh/MocA family oxidoreductase [Planctomycetes bacterium]|nr:Gfo/Idh/MocA family oxidoreductase [Planctomycetota bacterium]